MRKHPHINPFGGADEAVQRAAQKTVPPMLLAGMADKNLCNAMSARVIHQGFNRVVAVKGLRLRCHLTRLGQPPLKYGFILLINPVMANLHSEKLSVEPVGVASSARQHGLSVGAFRQANQNALLRAPMLLNAVGEEVILKLPVNHFGGQKQRDLAQGREAPRLFRWGNDI